LPYMGKSNKAVAECLGKCFYGKIKKALRSGKIPKKYNELMALVREFIVNDSLLQAATIGILTYTGDGFKTKNQVSKNADGSAAQQEKLCRSLEKLRVQNLEAISNYLEENKDSEELAAYKKCLQEDQEECPPGESNESTEGNEQEECPCNGAEPTSDCVQSSCSSVFVSFN